MRERTDKALETPAFRELVVGKRRFVVSAFVFLLIFFFPLPVLTAFTSLLDGQVVGTLNWAYLYAFAQFVVAWAVAILYWRKARRFDELARQVREEAEKSGGDSP